MTPDLPPLIFTPTLLTQLTRLLQLVLECRLAHTSDQSVGNGLGLAIDLWVS